MIATLNAAEVERHTELDDLSARANAAHTAAESTINLALDHAKDAGNALSEIKRIAGHGGFSAWLNDEFHGSERTARVYMQIAANWPAIEAARSEAGALSIAGALRAVAKPAKTQNGRASADLPAKPASETEPDPFDPGDESAETLARKLGQAIWRERRQRYERTDWSSHAKKQLEREVKKATARAMLELRLLYTDAQVKMPTAAAQVTDFFPQEDVDDPAVAARFEKLSPTGREVTVL